MDPQQQQLKQLQDLFSNANDVLIVTREQPTLDGICALLAISSVLSTQRTPQGKQKRIITAVSGRRGSQYSLLPGSDKIVSELGLRDLVIGVNGYTDNSIESVNWYVDRGRLNVVFKSNPAVPMQFDLKNLDPFYAGANFDAVIVLDTAAPTDLGNAYRQDPGMYSELPVVNISTQAQNTRFGKVNIVDPNVPSVSELVFQLIQILHYSPTTDAATLLMTGIAAATQNFQNKGAQTDAIISQLEIFGARQLDIQALQNQANNAPLPSGQPPVAQTAPYPGQIPPGAQFPYGMPGYGMVPPYGAFPPPGFPPQGYYPNMMPYPGQFPPGYPPGVGYPPVNAQTLPSQPETEVIPQDGDYDPQDQYYDLNPAEVPSIQHDVNYAPANIPTADVSGYSHVEPSIYMENLPNAPYQPNEDWDQNQKEVVNPDFKQAPKIAGDNRNK